MQSISLHQALIDMVLEQYEYAAIFLIAGKQKSTEEEIVCALAPFGALSHLSAMFVHGITDRIPNKIYYTAPADTVWRSQYLRYLQNKGIDGDRKSTRLNSSHVAISYAVFCLKKKKKRNR